MDLVVLVILIAVVAAGLLVVFVVAPRRRRTLPPPTRPEPGVDYRPGVGDDAETPRDTATRTIDEVTLPPKAPPEPAIELPVEEAPPIEAPAPAEGRLVRLRARLARSQTALGRSLLGLLSRETIDEDTWEEVEDSLLAADLGVGPTQELVDALRTRVRVVGARDQDSVRQLLREELLQLIGPDLDRTLHTSRHIDENRPAIVMIVGVNGTGKTTTAGKLARLLVADGYDVVLGAADTFRAAAVEQLTTWGERVGVPTVRGPEGGDPASVAYDAVRAGIELEADTVVIDTAGRLHTKVGLMDELGKVKRVVEKQAPVDEVLLVLDATTGQNGLIQARVFADVVDVTGIVLTKLDGTAKGGIVVAVQRELGVPVKLVGLGEGPDDLAPFDPVAFVDALVGD
jgi:fused signal recognition particle receptor